MKKNLFFALILSLVFFSCAEYDSSHGTPPPGMFKTTEATSTNTTSSTAMGQWWPMAVGNSWTMTAMGGLDVMTITGTETVGGLTYFVSNRDEDGYERFRYAANGDLYSQEVDSANVAEAEYLAIPANPTVNQAWYTPDSTTQFKVESLNATIGAYSSLLSIAVYDPTDGTKAAVLYYKKGIGFVGSSVNFFGSFIEMLLVSYVVK